MLLLSYPYINNKKRPNLVLHRLLKATIINKLFVFLFLPNLLLGFEPSENTNVSALDCSDTPTYLNKLIIILIP